VNDIILEHSRMIHNCMVEGTR